MLFWLTVLSLLLEAGFGYPTRLFQWVGHPVTWIGAAIDRAERRWNRPAQRHATRRLVGSVTLLGLLIIVALLSYLIASGLGTALAWLAHQTGNTAAVGGIAALLLTALLASTLLAQRSLDAHVAAVAEALERSGVAEGRQAVALIVGRDTDRLDLAGVCRAAIESLAESFSDGVVAPALWLALAGLPGAAVYKAINTADSMIGHRTDRYSAYGWAAARLDDVANWPAARLASLWLIVAAALTPTASARGAMSTVWRDAGHHRSPNAGWPEAAMAGALGISLAGPRSYGGAAIAGRWIGDGSANATASDIRAALRLYRTACGIQIAAYAGLAAVAVAAGWPGGLIA